MASMTVSPPTYLLASSRYATLFAKAMARLPEVLDDTDKAFTQFLTSLPFLPNAAFDILQAYCEHPDRITLGLSTLRDLIVQRPTSRETALQLVLSYASLDNEALRSPAIRLLTNKLFPIPSVSKSNAIANSSY